MSRARLFYARRLGRAMRRNFSPDGSNRRFFGDGRKLAACGTIFPKSGIAPEFFAAFIRNCFYPGNKPTQFFLRAALRSPTSLRRKTFAPGQVSVLAGPGSVWASHPSIDRNEILGDWPGIPHAPTIWKKQLQPTIVSRPPSPPPLDIEDQMLRRIFAPRPGLRECHQRGFSQIGEMFCSPSPKGQAATSPVPPWARPWDNIRPTTNRIACHSLHRQRSVDDRSAHFFSGAQFRGTCFCAPTLRTDGKWTEGGRFWKNHTCRR